MNALNLIGVREDLDINLSERARDRSATKRRRMHLECKPIAGFQPIRQLESSDRIGAVERIDLDSVQLNHHIHLQICNY